MACSPCGKPCPPKRQCQNPANHARQTDDIPSLPPVYPCQSFPLRATCACTDAKVRAQATGPNPGGVAQDLFPADGPLLAARSDDCSTHAPAGLDPITPPEQLPLLAATRPRRCLDCPSASPHCIAWPAGEATAPR